MPMLYISKNTVLKAQPLQSSQLPREQKADLLANTSYTVRSVYPIGNHYFVELTDEIRPVGRSGYIFADHVAIGADPVPPVKEQRGVWITNVDSTVLQTRNGIRDMIERLAELRFNTLYPVVWNRGYTLYPSAVADEVIGQPFNPHRAMFGDRDMLAELIEEAQPYGFRIIPWFEYGLMTPPDSGLAQQYPEWITQAQSGEKIEDHQVWLNPAHPNVVKFLSELISEVVRNYKVDGIQLDDHFGLPSNLGYDPLSRKLYRQDTGNFAPPLDPENLAWKIWRGNNLTQLLRTIFKAAKAENPGCTISLSPNPYGFSLKRYLADWRLWEQDGLIEELVLQIYRDNLLSFEAELRKPEVIAARNHIPVSVGVLTGLKLKPVASNMIQRQVKSARRMGFAGVSCFFYETLMHETLTPQKIARRFDDLKLIFD